MLRLARLPIVGLLACTIGSCDATSRYLAGMGDPKYFTWEQGEVAAATRASPPQAQLMIGGTGLQMIPNDSALEAIEEPKPASASTHPTTLAQDLRDCEAPGLRAESPAAGAPTGSPTIERSETSPVVAACMAAKGYRKVYETETDVLGGLLVARPRGAE
jgi:hypothetical protein